MKLEDNVFRDEYEKKHGDVVVRMYNGELSSEEADKKIKRLLDEKWNAINAHWDREFACIASKQSWFDPEPNGGASC